MDLAAALDLAQDDNEGLRIAGIGGTNFMAKGTYPNKEVQNAAEFRVDVEITMDWN